MAETEGEFARKLFAGPCDFIWGASNINNLPPQSLREVAEVSCWPVLQEGMAKALLDIRALGVCCSFGEWQKEINAIAVPVRDGDGRPLFALSLAAIRDRITPDRRHGLVTLLKNEAADLERRLPPLMADVPMGVQSR